MGEIGAAAVMNDVSLKVDVIDLKQCNGVVAITKGTNRSPLIEIRMLDVQELPSLIRFFAQLVVAELVKVVETHSAVFPEAAAQKSLQNLAGIERR